MAKFFGEIGFAESKQTSPGVWEEVITTRQYYGDVLQSRIRWQANEHVNDDLSLDNRISVLADEYALSNFAAMRYVEWGGAKWKVNSIEVSRPRIILTLGEVWNGD